MNKLLEIQHKLLDTGAAMARIEQGIREDPSRREAAFLNLSSLQKRQKRLEESFDEELDRNETDVCNYRFLPTDERTTIAGLSEVFKEFQTLVSVIYDSLKTKSPKKRASFGAESERETAFSFGYSYPGSLGIVLTLRNERLLPSLVTTLDEAISTAFAIVKLRDPNEIRAISRKLGVAVIQKTYLWAGAHITHGFDAEIQWRRKKELRSSAFLQRLELEAFRHMVATTCDEMTEHIEVVGDLVGADVARNTFHFKTEKADYGGGSDVLFSPEQRVELPKSYKATIRKTTSVKLATEEEEITYTLIHLGPLN